MKQGILEELVATLKQLSYDDPVIAVAGSHAKGQADSHSDIDLFLFFRNPKPYEERKRILQQFSDDGTQPWITENFDYPWGGSADFTYQGIPVETTVRLIPEAERIAANCLRGEFSIIPQTWTSNGYYTYIYLSEFSFLKPLYDPQGFLAKYRKMVEVYPPKLKRSILRCFLQRAGTWVSNFHYKTAVTREDSLFVAPIVIHTLMDMIQIIFALNERYYPGDKKLEQALKSLAYCPAQLLENLDFLLTLSKDTTHYQQQRELLTAIYQELTQKCALVGI